MSTRIPAEVSSGLTALPPIVLLVEQDREWLAMASRDLDRAGLWTATASDPEEALLTAQELKPDVVVTDLLFDQERGGASLLHELKHGSGLEDTPVIVLTDRDWHDVPVETRSDADAVLVKPVAIDQLLQRIRVTIDKRHRLRARGNAAVERGHVLREPPDRIRRRPASADRLTAVTRACPTCGAPLEWLERRTLGGSDYDYYRWCVQGCGLFCYDRTTGRWLKLAR